MCLVVLLDGDSVPTDYTSLGLRSEEVVDGEIEGGVWKERGYEGLGQLSFRKGSISPVFGIEVRT